VYGLYIDGKLRLLIKNADLKNQVEEALEQLPKLDVALDMYIEGYRETHYSSHRVIK